MLLCELKLRAEKMVQLNDLMFVCFLLVQLNNLMLFLGVKLLSHDVHFVYAVELIESKECSKSKVPQ
jgi:hypothetical protein